MKLRQYINLFTEQDANPGSREPDLSNLDPGVRGGNATSNPPPPKQNVGTAAGYKGTAGARSIAQASGVQDPNKIKVGQTLTLPGGGTYQVQKGDTLDKIARKNPAAAAPAAATAPAPPVQNKPDADAAAKQDIFKPPSASTGDTSPQPAAPGQRPGGVAFNQDAGSSAGSPAAPTTNPVVNSPFGRFAQSAGGQTVTTEPQQQSAMPSSSDKDQSSYTNPTAVTLGAEQPEEPGTGASSYTSAAGAAMGRQGQSAMSSGGGIPVGTGTPGVNVGTGTPGVGLTSRDFSKMSAKDTEAGAQYRQALKPGPAMEEAEMSEETEQSIEEELAEAFNDMLRLSGLRLNEMSDREADMQRRMAATRASAAGMAPGQTQTSSSGPTGTGTMTVKTGSGASSAPATTAAPAQQAAPAAPASAQTAKPGFSAVGRGAVDFEESVDELEEELAEAFNSMLKLSGIPLNEKAVSRQQQKFMGMVHAMQKGEKVKGASPELKKVAKTMGKKDAKDFAATKHKGLPQKVSESIMLEAGNNLEHIVTRFKHETKRFLNGDDLDSDLYEALYDYYVDAGEMPYGVAKAREGDPFQWVGDRFESDLSNMGYDRKFDEMAMPMVDKQLSELALLAGLHESRVDECGDMGMERDHMQQKDRLNVTTNMSSDGTKDVTINAQGDAAEDLLSMLKLAGMGGSDRPVVAMIDRDEEMMDEERETQYANTPAEEYETVDRIIRQGNDLNREKKQFANMPKAGDNPMATDYMLDEELLALLDSVLVKEADPQRPKGDTGVADIYTADKGIAPPSPDEGPVGKTKSPAAPAAPKAPIAPGIKR